MVEVIMGYGIAGLVFGGYFVVRGYAALDAAAATASVGLRLLWLPAAIVLWPVLLRRVWAVRGAAT